MATAGSGLAEAYVMRKLHKEKMKKAEEAERTTKIGSEAKTPSSGSNGCFFWLSKNSQDRKTARISDSYCHKESPATGDLRS